MGRGITVDGPRPAVEWVTSIPRAWGVTAPERLILMCLACDAFDWESAPGYDAVADWTGMQRSSCAEILTRLCEAAPTRPALLEKISVMGRRRTIFRIIGKETFTDQPSGATGRFRGGPDAEPDEVNRPAGPDGSTADSVDAEAQPSGHTGRFNRPAGPDGSGQPSGATGRFDEEPNRPATQDGSAPQKPSTVGEPSANRPAPPDTPLALNPKDQNQGQNLGADAQADGLFEAPPPPPPAKATRKTRQPKERDPDDVHAQELCAIWWDKLPVKPSGTRSFRNVIDLICADIKVGRTDEEIAWALRECGVAVTRNALNTKYEMRRKNNQPPEARRGPSRTDSAVAALQARKSSNRVTDQVPRIIHPARSQA